MEELKEIRAVALRSVSEIVVQNKEEIIQTYHIVMRMAYVCQKDGLLALENPVSFMPKDMLLFNEIAEMVNLITDGQEARFVSEMLTVKFMVNQYCGLEAFLYYLYARSLLLIQAGMSPYQIECFFNFVIPGKTFQFDEQRKMQNEYNRKKLQELKAGLSDRERERLSESSRLLCGLTEQEWKKLVGSDGFCGFETILPFLGQEAQDLTAVYMNQYRYQAIMNSPGAASEQEMLQAAKELEEKVEDLRKKDDCPCLLEDILKCSDEEIRKLIGEVEREDLIIALKGVKEEIMESFLRNMTNREKYCLKQDMEYMGPVRLCDVEDAQRRILQTVKGNGLFKD